MNSIFFLIPFLLITSISLSQDSFAVEQIVIKHINQDTIKRSIQSFDVKNIERGSNVIGVDVIFTLDDSIGKKCVLILNEQGLNKDQISNVFDCMAINTIELNNLGNDSLQSRLNNEKFTVDVKIIDNDEVINVISKNINLDVTFVKPTYYAKIENGIVTNVIVADQVFVDSQSGTWIETKTDYSLNGKYAGIGDSFDGVKNKFIPKSPYPSWNLTDGVWISPVPYPDDGLKYIWNESIINWVAVK